jgi:hypothetical protein
MAAPREPFTRIVSLSASSCRQRRGQRLAIANQLRRRAKGPTADCSASPTPIQTARCRIGGQLPHLRM